MLEAIQMSQLSLLNEAGINVMMTLEINAEAVQQTSQTRAYMELEKVCCLPRVLTPPFTFCSPDVVVHFLNI